MRPRPRRALNTASTSAHDLPELGGRLQERRLQSALQRRSSGNAPISFEPETAETFELGFKLDPTDSLRVNIAAFTTDYDDIQMTYRLGVVPLLFNAGVATIDGGELELELRADR